MLTWAEQQAADDTAFQRVERDAIKTHQAIGASIVADAATRAELGARLAMLRLHRLDGLNALALAQTANCAPRPKFRRVSP